MIYGTLGPATCRKAEMIDYDRMLEILVPFIKTDSADPTFRDMEVRTAKKLMKYFIREGLAIVAEEDGIVVGMYTGKGNKIGNIANIGSLHAMVLLMKVAMCDIQNLTAEAYFQVANDKIRKVYESIKTPTGEACKIDALGNGVVSVEAKNEMLQLFNILKG